MKLKKLILVRHGEYNLGTKGLSDNGCDQINYLVDKIAPFINKGNTTILSSTAKRAAESADIISERTGVGYENHEILWSDEEHREDYEGAMELIEQHINKVETLVLVTHYEYAERLPGIFAKAKLAKNIWPVAIPKGYAAMLDCVTGDFQIING